MQGFGYSNPDLGIPEGLGGIHRAFAPPLAIAGS